MTDLDPRGFRMTSKSFAAILLVSTALAWGAPALAQDATTPATEAPAAEAAPAAPTPDTVVATVGAETITEADLAFAAEEFQEQMAQMPAEERRAFLVTVLIDMKVMAKAAKDAQMDQTDIFKRRLQYLEERSLRRAYFAEKIAGSVTEDGVRAAYDAYATAFVPAEEVHARHILVATKEEADAVKAELDAGKPFEVAAMEKTTDPSGKQNGGDLGFFSKGMMVPEFETTAFGLEIGQVSAPVQSQFGWHIIRLDEKRMTSPAAFEQVAPQLGQQMILEAFDQSVSELKAAMPVSIPDAALAAAVQRQSEPVPAAPQ